MKKFKKFIFCFVLIVHPLTAQSDAETNQECLQNLSIFVEYAKVKNYADAYAPWINVKEACPKLNLAIYTYGERMLKDKIKNTAPESKQAAAAELLNLYDQWLENFPTRRNVSVKGDIISKKAQAMLDYKTSNKMEVYKVFDLAFTSDINSFTSVKGLYNYFKTLYDLYREGNDGVTMEQLFDKYEEVSEKFELESTKLAKKLDMILKKEENGTPLSSREVRSKRIYQTNGSAIGTLNSNLDAIISKEATLYIGQFKFSRISTASSENGELKILIFFTLA